jgi:hypothetical protein
MPETAQGWVEPEPGNPDGNWRLRSTQLARGHRSQSQHGWEYTTTSALDGDPFNMDTPPPGGGWERNAYKGTDGYEVRETASGRDQHVTYWRRQTGKR